MMGLILIFLCVFTNISMYKYQNLFKNSVLIHSLLQFLEKFLMLFPPLLSVILDCKFLRLRILLYCVSMQDNGTMFLLRLLVDLSAVITKIITNRGCNEWLLTFLCLDPVLLWKVEGEERLIHFLPSLFISIMCRKPGHPFGRPGGLGTLARQSGKRTREV